jgi:hypothetical protein
MEGERWTMWDARDTCPKKVKKEEQGERQAKKEAQVMAHCSEQTRTGI